MESRLTSGSYKQAYVRGLGKCPFLEVSGNRVSQITDHQHIVPGCGKGIRVGSTAVDYKVEDRQVDSIVGRSIAYLDISKSRLDRPIKPLNSLQPSFEDLAGVFDI
jgi:hypothetical protein